MTRREFTKQIITLINEMVLAGEQPIIDYALRSFDEQHRLFEEGLSKCDGKEKISKHQQGIAIDLYLCHFNDLGAIIVDYTWNQEKALKWHARWQELGGREVISWDLGHFEGL